MGHDVAGDAKGMGVVVGEVIRDPRGAAVQIPAAQGLGVHDLAGRGLHELRSAEIDRPLVPHDDGLVRHRRHIGTARDAIAHDHRDLGDPERREPGLVIEDPAEVLAVGKHLCLERQEGPARIDQINARQPVFLGDLLRPQVFLGGDRIVRPAFHRGVVRDHHDIAAMDLADAGDDAARWQLVSIETEAGQRRQFQERAVGIEQGRDALARQQLAALPVPLTRRLGAAGERLGEAFVQIRNEPAQVGCVLGEPGRVGIDARR